ncbi:MAG: hypothetical protein ACI9S8_002236 [Chlamydiales bacterium]|jgi:hypothetical protein
MALPVAVGLFSYANTAYQGYIVYDSARDIFQSGKQAYREKNKLSKIELANLAARGTFVAAAAAQISNVKVIKPVIMTGLELTKNITHYAVRRTAGGQSWRDLTQMATVVGRNSEKYFFKTACNSLDFCSALLDHGRGTKDALVIKSVIEDIKMRNGNFFICPISKQLIISVLKDNETLILYDKKAVLDKLGNKKRITYKGEVIVKENLVEAPRDQVRINKILKDVAKELKRKKINKALIKEKTGVTF